MKLFHCNVCRDVVALRGRMRVCYCGSSFGMMPSRESIELGGEAVLIEFSDDTLSGAIAKREEYKRRPFSAWVAPKREKAISYIRRDDSCVVEFRKA